MTAAVKKINKAGKYALVFVSCVVFIIRELDSRSRQTAESCGVAATQKKTTNGGFP